jgi:hypothetical protein
MLLAGRSINGTTAMRNNAYSNLNCYEDLLDEKCIVLPWEQLTYIDSGIYNDDHKIVFSALERAKRPFNQLKLIEDAILIYRLSRSPEKYVFNVDIGKMSARAGEQKVAQLKKQFGSKKVYDPGTGTIGKAYDPMQMSENFWFIKGSDSQGIQVSPLQSSQNFGNLEDLDYFKKNLLRALNIPIGRFYGDNTPLINNGDESGITADELNFAKFLMSQQKRFALGLLNGAITHLKYCGLWEAYRLTKNKIKITINPPVEYETYRRQKLLESKVNMMKTLLGEETVGKMFSSELALEVFMGWDRSKIEHNKHLKFIESVEAARLEYLVTKIAESGTIDFKPDDESGKTLKEILQQGLTDSFIEAPQPESNESEGDSGEDSGEETGDEFEDESTADEL